MKGLNVDLLLKYQWAMSQTYSHNSTDFIQYDQIMTSGGKVRAQENYSP